MTNPTAANWRDIGDTTLDEYKKEFSSLNSPLLPYAAELFNAAKPYSALALAHMKVENQYSTTGILITREMKNPLSLRPRYGEKEVNGFASFASYTDAMNAWKRRFTDPNLGYANTTTLEQYLNVYAPSGDVHPVTGVDNSEMDYLGNVKRLLTRYSEGETQMAYTPTIIDRWLHVSQLGYSGVERRYVGRFGMAPKIIVLHIQQGTNLGSWQWFHNVTASATVLIGKNGEIWRLVPESDAPWTNGDVKTPSALGWEVMSKWGADPNVYTLSIETEGMTDEWPKPQAQLNAVVWQVQQWMTKYNIPAKYVIRHAEINSVDRRYCPGDAYYNYVIKAIQGTIPTQTTWAERSPVLDGTANWDGSKDVKFNGVTFYGDRKTVHAAVAGVPVRQYATTQSGQTRAPLTANEEFSVLGWVNGEAVKGDTRWWITKSYSRVHVSGTKEKPTAETGGGAADQLPSGAKIVDGIAYYPAKDGANPQALTVAVDEAIVRAGASRDTAEVKRVHKGDKLKAAYWTFGGEVKNERIWWVLNETSDPIKNGGRLWCAATTERPS